jgi:hypothetical protein
LDDRPVLFFEIKPPGHINFVSARIAADAQMRSRFASFYDVIPDPTPKLHGISVMRLSTRWREPLDIWSPNTFSQRLTT